MLAAVGWHNEDVVISRRYAHQHGLPADEVEFQMLYGIRRELQAGLVKKGIRCGCTYRTGHTGILTTCGGSPNGRRIYCSSYERWWETDLPRATDATLVSTTG